LLAATSGSTIGPMSSTTPSDEATLRQQICEMGRRMWQRGYVAANDGNISARLGEGRFLCTPTGVSKGFMTSEQLCVVDAEGNQLAGGLARTSEVLLHLAIYRDCPHLSAVAHAHSPNVMAFAITDTPIPTGILPEVEALIGPVPLLPFVMNGTPELAETVVPFFRKRHTTIIMANHGVVAGDRTVEQAYFHIETLESYCQVLLAARPLGELKPLDESTIEKLLDWKRNQGIDDPRLEA
jgi:L-fuculose-phosphate aldolase